MFARRPALSFVTSAAPSPAWWQWPTILSLDAPLVCLLWQTLLAVYARAPLSFSRTFVLAASVWLAYVTDRWIEGWRLASPVVRTPRHRFYQRHRWPVLLAWIAVLVVDLSVSFSALDRAALARGFLLLIPLLAYLLSHQFVHRHSRWRAPKEIVIALLLTAGVGILIPVSASAVLFDSLAAFALVCFVNCALISRWERDVDIAHGQTSLALQSARGATLIGALPWAIAAAGLAALPLIPAEARVPVACATTSALLLGIVDRFEQRVGWRVARVLADAAMLTPCVPLLLR